GSEFDSADSRRCSDRLVIVAECLVERRDGNFLVASLAAARPGRDRARSREWQDYPSRKTTLRLERQGGRPQPFRPGKFVLTLQPLPGVDPIRSLRWILKGLLRRTACVA